VTERLLPSIDDEIAKLTAEAERLGVMGSPLYEHAIGLQRHRARWIDDKHRQFMEPYRPHLPVGPRLAP
jgi:hypothetical protein